MDLNNESLHQDKKLIFAASRDAGSCVARFWTTSILLGCKQLSLYSVWEVEDEDWGSFNGSAAESWELACKVGRNDC